MLGLYHNEGNGLFVDEAPRSPVGRASLLSLTFGLFFFDYDLDGYPDIFAANGHIEEEIGRVQPKIQYARAAAAVPQQRQRQVRTRCTAFTRAAGGARRGLRRFRSRWRSGRARSPPTTARRICIATMAATQSLAAAEAGRARRAIATASARWCASPARSGKQRQTVHSGSSYCSASDLALTFGLGKDDGGIAIEIEWPSGKQQKLDEREGEPASGGDRNQ